MQAETPTEAMQKLSQKSFKPDHEKKEQQMANLKVWEWVGVWKIKVLKI